MSAGKRHLSFYPGWKYDIIGVLKFEPTKQVMLAQKAENSRIVGADWLKITVFVFKPWRMPLTAICVNKYRAPSVISVQTIILASKQNSALLIVIPLATHSCCNWFRINEHVKYHENIVSLRESWKSLGPEPFIWISRSCADSPKPRRKTDALIGDQVLETNIRIYGICKLFMGHPGISGHHWVWDVRDATIYHTVYPT